MVVLKVSAIFISLVVKIIVKGKGGIKKTFLSYKSKV
jgi:hypothetical protein